MKYAIAVIGLTTALSVVASHPCLAEPGVLMLNLSLATLALRSSSCRWAEQEIKSDQYLIRAFKCSESELCQRAIDISAACKVTGPVALVQAFYSKLLAQFASNAQCSITIMRLTDGQSDVATKNDLEAFKRANWELNLAFVPGARTQEWALWPYNSGEIVASGLLEGEGDPNQIARDVCTIVTHGGAKILN